MARVILHCDLNNFYASVECKRDPALKNRPMAVCGSVEERHGIVLAKNQLAKQAGVRTGEPVWQAKEKCPDLVTVPPNFEDYVVHSKRVRKIYCRYTDRVEPMGIDECWLDVSGSVHLFGSGYEIACEIKEAIKKEVGITASVGVSFNKIFAKLGSDLKKPDAVTCITEENFKEQIWHLPANTLMGVGGQTYQKLCKHNIKTIGDLAACPPEILQTWFGKMGPELWRYANGHDPSEVARLGDCAAPKSVGRGITTAADLKTPQGVRELILALSQEVGAVLRRRGLSAQGLSVAVKDNALETREYRGKLPYLTQSSRVIAEAAFALFQKRHVWQRDIRAVTVRVTDLAAGEIPEQLSLFMDYDREKKLTQLEKTMDAIREKYGTQAIDFAACLKDTKKGRQKSPSPFKF